MDTLLKIRFLFGIFSLATIIHGSPIENPELRISGGTDSQPGSAPYNVVVLFRDSYICSGSIISRRTILTAEQCIDDKNPLSFSILVNTTKISEPGRLYRVRNVTSHHGTNNIQMTHDLSLLILEEDIELSKDVQVIELVTKPINGGLETITRGWGLTDVTGSRPDNLQEITLKTLDLDECRKRWDDLMEVQIDEICAYSKNGGGMCFGDAGGALIHDGKAIGVSSWGYACVYGHPDVFTSVSYHIDWIRKNMI